MSKVPALAAALLASALSLPSIAHEVVYTTHLTGPAESPPNASPGTGDATVVFDLDMVTMHVEVSFAGLAGPTTASHIHCCTTVPGTGTATVATTLPTFTDFPLGVMSGTYDHTFDMTDASSYNPAFVSAHGGTVATALSALLAGLDAGEAYLNIHTTSFPTGEIRGFLAPVPEPETYALMLGGLAVLATLRRRRSADKTT
jgi:hypothetical protein